ncbi:hypothetical protein BO70DRAFT_332391 [Aspergillus heteromorphus CBS 117.55]|uniref:Uncharacterized protein n=1 Tax=Aspergillus heteromorphus CBS 117.55 TaxID=1448321 RepID=A0A317WQD1_9EURO|nr:uncharacterized protein BO70DRAFT_332391 [Aspergillus heteromorphus CBS 117.55]PWY87492.1 hypothetical protein BO70DRAFT_332391 [Aspergillus heteromorphus CBS 117.55]
MGTEIDLSSHQEEEVAYALDNAKVPYCIWGRPLLRIYGDSATQFSGWVIPDDRLEDASETLVSIGYRFCQIGEECDIMQNGNGSHPHSDYHFHPDEVLQHSPRNGLPTVTISLYPKSSILWSFPDPPVGLPEPNDAYYMLASDERLPCHIGAPLSPWLSWGRRSPERYPLKIPKPIKYLENMVARRCRALDGSEDPYHWMKEIYSLVNIMMSNRIPNLLFLDGVSSPFERYLAIMCNDIYPLSKRKEKAWEYLHVMYADLKNNFALPPPGKQFFRAGEDLNTRIAKWQGFCNRLAKWKIKVLEHED